MKLSVKIAPNARKNEITGFENNILKIKLAAPPIDGKANKALIAFFAKIWSVPKSHIKILKGETSRTKILDIPDKLSTKISVLKQL